MPGSNSVQSPISDLKESLQWIHEILDEAEPFLNTDEAKEILQAEMSTPEGQKLYYDTQNAFSGHSEAINNAVQEMRSDLANRGVISQSTAAAAGTAAQSSGTSQSVAQLQQANETLGEVRKAVSASTGAGTVKGSSILGNTSAQATAGTTTAAKTASAGKVYDGGKDYQCTTPQQCANTQVNSGMVSYIQNSQSQLNSSNVNQTDYMVVSQLAYMSKSVPGSTQPYQRGVNGESKTVGQYCNELLNRMETSMKNGGTVDAAEYQYVKAMANSNRYKDLKLDSVVPYHDGKVDTCVVSIDIGDGKGIIGVQGTNGTVQDWVNNGEFSGNEPSREEQYIIQNVEQLVAKNGYDGIYLTGHSQGGRDAVSAAVFSNDETRDKIIGVYNLDGPGYRDEMLSKYETEFNQMADKIHNVYPNGSYVGQIYKPVGDSSYTEAQGDSWYAYVHSPFNWEVDPQTGEAVPADKCSVQYITSKLIDAVADYASSKLSPEQTNEAWSIIMRLAYDENDVTQLNFGNILNHLDEVSFGDALVLANAAATVALSAVADYCEYVEKACDILMVVGPLVGLPEIVPICEAIKKAVKIVKTVCKVVCWILKKIAEWREKKKREERAKYKASNPDLTFVYQALMDAATHLEKANDWILQADRDCDGVRRGFLEESIIDEIISWITKPFSSIKSLFSYFSVGITDLLYLHNQANLKKGVRCCNLVAAEGVKVMQSVPYATSDRDFHVTPSALGSHASAGSEAVTATKKEFTSAGETMTGLKTSWQGDDYDSLKALTDQDFQKFQEQLDNLANGFGILSTAAEVYGSFQDRCIEEFQAAAQ